MRTKLHTNQSSPPTIDNSAKILVPRSLEKVSDIKQSNRRIMQSLYSRPTEHWTVRWFSILGPIVLGVLAALFLLSLSQ